MKYSSPTLHTLGSGWAAGQNRVAVAAHQRSVSTGTSQASERRRRVWSTTRVAPCSRTACENGRSALERPTLSTISPGSTIRSPSRPVNDARSAGTVKRTSACCARLQLDARRSRSSRCTGRTTDATGSCR